MAISPAPVQHSSTVRRAGLGALSPVKRWQAIGTLVVLSALMLVPLVAPSVFYVGLATEMLTFGLWAMSLDVLIGYTGLVSFGHAAYFGLGAYGTGLLANKLGLSFLPTFAGGVLLAALAALITGSLIVRLSGIAFAMLTLAFSMIIYTVIWRWSSLTGGDDGVTLLRPNFELLWLKVNLQAPERFYYLVLSCVAVAYYLTWRFISSPVGATLCAIRENRVRAAFIGINVWRYKLISFIVAGLLAGIAGSLYGAYREFASPDLLHWSASGQVLTMAILGGTGTLFGPFIGAGVVILLQDLLSSYTQYWLLPFGFIFVVVVRYFPRGIAGAIRLVFGRR